MGNDVPFFSIVQEMVSRKLRLPLGRLTVFVESFHAYERHFELLEKLSEDEAERQEPMAVPAIEDDLEVEMLLEGDDSDMSMTRPFTRWLYVTP
jgi:thymidylate synthase